MILNEATKGLLPLYGTGALIVIMIVLMTLPTVYHRMEQSKSQNV